MTIKYKETILDIVKGKYLSISDIYRQLLEKTKDKKLNRQMVKGMMALLEEEKHVTLVKIGNALIYLPKQDD